MTTTENQTPPVEQSGTNPQGNPTEATQTPVAQDPRARAMAAFLAYQKNQGITRPANFLTDEAWFSSLENAQKEFTQARQQLAEMQKQLAATTPGVAYVPPSVEAVPATTPVVPAATPVVAPTGTPTGAPTGSPAVAPPDAVLAIPEAPASPPVPSGNTPVTQEEWNKWTAEFVTNKKMSEGTMKEIMARTNLDEATLNIVLQGQKARLDAAYAAAANIVGGNDKLNAIFAWAQKTYTKEQQAQINNGLRSASWEITLRGLEAAYLKASPAPAKEPQAVKPAPVTSVGQGIQPFSSRAEFAAWRNNPRFNTDPAFRDTVIKRQSITNWDLIA